MKKCCPAVFSDYSTLFQVQLSTADIGGIPVAFDLSKHRNGFWEYAAQHPDSLWLAKNKLQRHVALKSLNEIREKFNEKDTFLQEFIKNPLLIDRRQEFLFSNLFQLLFITESKVGHFS